MDMKRILQAMDEVSTKPVEGADSMSKFLRVVKEAEINQPAVTPIKVPPVPQLPAQDGDQGDGSSLTTNQDGTKTYAGAFGRFTYDAQGKAISYAEPQFTGLGRSIDLTTGQTTQNYNAGPLNTTQTTDAKGNVVSHNTEYDLGVGVASKGRDAKGITSKSWQGRGEEAKDIVSNKDLYAAGNKDKEATYDRAMAQVKSAPVQEGIDKFLSIVRKNDVSILNEGANPHKVALPVQMTMQHYQKDTVAKTENSLLKKYFHEVETEITEQKTAKRQLVNQYARVIAERVIKKQSKNKILNEDESDEESERHRYPHYYKHKDKTIFRLDDPESPNGYRDIRPEDDEWDSIYQQEFPDYPLPKETGGFYIGNHPLVKGSDDTDEPVGEMAAHLRNDPDGHTIIPHGGMGSGKEETWKSVSTRKLQQVIDMINSGNYTGAEHVLYKNGFLQGAVQALARYEEFKIKQGKRRMKAGREVDIGEGALSRIFSKYVAKGTPDEVKLSGGLYNNRDQKVFQQFGVFPDEKAAQEFIGRHNIQDPMIDPVKKSALSNTPPKPDVNTDPILDIATRASQDPGMLDSHVKSLYTYIERNKMENDPRWKQAEKMAADYHFDWSKKNGYPTANANPELARKGERLRHRALVNAVEKVFGQPGNSIDPQLKLKFEELLSKF